MEKRLSVHGKTVAEVLVELLHQAGVKRIFGVAGDALNALTDALRKDGRIEWLGFRHEENAAYAAYGEAALTGGLGVCAGTVGPGALHLINGLYNAKREGASVLAITGQVPSHERGTGYFQEVDLAKVFDDVCGYQALITSPSQMARVSEIAIQKALADRLVSRLEVPIDLMTLEVPSQAYIRPIVCSRPRAVPPLSEIEQAAKLINDARKITLFCGIGCRDACNEVVALSERLNAPIAHTLRAKEVFDSAHSNVMGLTGLIGVPPAYRAVLDCDLLVMLGTNFPYENFLPSSAKIIQVDEKIENIGRRAPINLGLVGDVRETLKILLPSVHPAHKSSFLDSLVKMRTSCDEHFSREAEPASDDEQIRPQEAVKILSRIAGDDAVFVVDVGESTVWAARYLSLSGDRRMFGSFNHGSMGCALPIALGASSVDPKREIWAICGDGGFAMAMQDFVTASRFGWPIKVLILNNSELGFVKMENEVSGFPLNRSATDLLNPDFALLAQACGATGIRLERSSDLVSAIERAAAEQGPVVIDAIVSPGELTLPPKISFKQAWGFGLSKAKEALLGLQGDHRQWENIRKEYEANLKVSPLKAKDASSRRRVG